MQRKQRNWGSPPFSSKPAASPVPGQGKAAPAWAGRQFGEVRQACSSSRQVPCSHCLETQKENSHHRGKAAPRGWAGIPVLAICRQVPLARAGQGGRHLAVFSPESSTWQSGWAGVSWLPWEGKAWKAETKWEGWEGYRQGLKEGQGSGWLGRCCC